jgi:hypothetical protein
MANIDFIMSTNTTPPAPPKRAFTARLISASVLTGILLFIIPGTDATLGLRPGALSTLCFSLAFCVAMYSFIKGPSTQEDADS